MPTCTSLSHESYSPVCTTHNDGIVLGGELECFAIHSSSPKSDRQAAILTCIVVISFNLERLMESLLAKVVCPDREASGDRATAVTRVLDIKTDRVLACKVDTGLHIFGGSGVDYVYRI
jgi:hypothetical protein